MKELIIDLQNACNATDLPTIEQFKTWVSAVLSPDYHKAELSIRIVDELESGALNQKYRYKNGPTNILSFPSDLPEDIELDIPLIGDLVICANLVKQEAQEQNIDLVAHWAHLIVHGTLHLLDYDHLEDADAVIMEALEIQVLKSLGFNNPYEENAAL